jgi:Gluconate 2-dehydrogenase subunit 3
MANRGSGPPFFLTPDEYQLVWALMETIVPAGDGPVPEPGGVEVGAHNYFDSRILDLPEGARHYFRSALHLVDGRAGQRFGKSFANLSSEERSGVLGSLLADPTTMAPAFALRAICLEGFYSDYRDPSYTGRTAWDLIEFKGKRIDGIKKDWSFLRIYQEKGGP